MTTDFKTNMTISRYRELNVYPRIATTVGYGDIADKIGSIIGPFESGKKETFVSREYKNPYSLAALVKGSSQGSSQDVKVEEAFGLSHECKLPPVHVGYLVNDSVVNVF
ncbi:hypothetical protein EV361DRAFT_931178 [Lentinula raphanica]|nr:hypothetical protein EV361DRAFT_931178 [Lentinula raphanica]